MIGNRIKEIRKSKKISQQKLADMLGISKSSVSLYEMNKIDPSDLLKESIAQKLNISLDYLTGKTDIEEKYYDGDDSVEIQEKIPVKGNKNKLSDSFMDKLKQKNISVNGDKTKERVKNIWDSADKQNRKALIDVTGRAMYNYISITIKNGRITAKMTILLARYLDVNPFYIIGGADERGKFTEDVLKDFLITLGYKKLWTEYAKHLKEDKITKNKEINEPVEIISDTPVTIINEEKNDIEEQIADIPETTVDESIEKQENTEIPADIITADDELADIPPEILDYINTLSEENIVTLLRAALIRAKTPNANIKHKQLFNQLIYKMLTE